MQEPTRSIKGLLLREVTLGQLSTTRKGKTMVNEIKAMSMDEKVEYFRSILSNPGNVTETDTLNIFRLVNSYNTFDEEFFNNENSYIRDITEFIDLKLKLERDIKEFQNTLVKWYISILASCDIKADDEEETKVEMPDLICGFFASSNISIMSNIMNKVDLNEIDMSNLYRVKGAFMLLSTLFNSHAFVAGYIEMLSGNDAK